MSWLAQAALGGLFALGAWLAWDLARANLRHGHHERPAPPPELAHEPDFYGSMFVDEFAKDLAERYEMVDPAPWERAAREWHGYIPELDPGPEAAAPAPSPDHASHREDAQGRDVRVCADEPRPAAGADLTGSLSSRPPEEDPGQVAHAWPGLGPRAGAVLAAYEQRLGARREACT